MNYEHLDLFSGIGGFAIAARRTGWKTIGFSEIDGYASKVLAKNFPCVPNLGDIRNVRGIRADLITGGFPCQPYSLAGKRRGAADDRALWPEMCRVIADSRPRWVLGENVPGIINMELDRVLADLENLGYSAWPIVLPACAVNAKHRRNRVWIVGHDDGQRREGKCVPICEGGQDQAHVETDWTGEALANAKKGRLRCRETSRQTGQPSLSSEDVADTNGTGSQGRHSEGMCERASERTFGPCCSSTADTNSEPTRRLAKSRQEYCQWQPEPAVGRVANGIPNRVDRLKGLGNAIVPQVAEVILCQMIQIETVQEFPKP